MTILSVIQKNNAATVTQIATAITDCCVSAFLGHVTFLSSRYASRAKAKNSIPLFVREKEKIMRSDETSKVATELTVLIGRNSGVNADIAAPNKTM